MKRDKVRVDRRTVLRGVGVAMSLPWLESISVWGDESITGKPETELPRRFAAMFMGNGINSRHWWAKGSGAEMELSQSLEPLAPLKTKLNVINGLFNKQATGVGIHPGQTGNILSGAPLQKGAVLKGGISVDQVIANHFGDQTPSNRLRATTRRISQWPIVHIFHGMTRIHRFRWKFTRHWRSTACSTIKEQNGPRAFSTE